MIKNEIHLFEAYGIELEYMIVDAVTLDIKPICDELFKIQSGDYNSAMIFNHFAWSNELVNHVVEIKTYGPTPQIHDLAANFHENIREINSELERFGARLMPGSMHPWMNPFTETQLWKHEFSEIYSLYHKLFDCKNHGWANIQSTHLNLPFVGDDEFGKLHAAVRLILPLIPAIAASSPFMEGHSTQLHDSRLEAYRHNQAQIPIITGKIIPERVYTKAAYQKEIFDKIVDAIKPLDTDHLLDRHFLNSRGAIARFDRGSIEIRLTDVQESPRADIAIITGIISVLKFLCLERWTSTSEQKQLDENELLPILLETINKGEHAIISHTGFLRQFGINQESISAKEIWENLFEQFKPALFNHHAEDFEFILKNGTLSSRLLKRNSGSGKKALYGIYDELTDCLTNNTLFS